MGIVHQAIVPVLVIRLNIAEEEEGVRCVAACRDLRRHVLFCTDFSETADRAFQYVERIVQSGARFINHLNSTRFEVISKFCVAETACVIVRHLAKLPCSECRFWD